VPNTASRIGESKHIETLKPPAIFYIDVEHPKVADHFQNRLPMVFLISI
jgi:hypothetical protein